MKVILFCPVRQDAEVFALAARSHLALSGVAERWYSDGNDDPDTKKILHSAADMWWEDDSPEGPKYDFAAHRWPNEMVSRIAGIRNRAIRQFLKSNADALFLVDSDVIVPPGLVEALASLNTPIACEVFWSQWTPGAPWQPNVWDGHKYSFRSPESIIRLREPGQYQVGGFGACTLIRREVFEKGIRYEPVEGLADMWGEDRWFSIRASAHNIPIIADTTHPPFHVYRKEQLEEARTWFECGCPLGYFRDTWLTGEWTEAIERSMAKPAKKVFACVLPGEHFSQAWVGAWTELVTNLNQHFHVNAQFGFASNVYFIRQGMYDALRTISPQPDYILWIDDDQILTVEALQTLVRDLEQHQDLDGVCGWAWCENNIYGGLPMLSCGIFDREGKIKRLEFEEMQAMGSDLIPISYSGFPAVLMRGRVLDRIGPNPFMPVMDQEAFPPFGMSGEDVAFFIHAREAGLKFVVDRRVKVPHLKLRCAEPVLQASLESASVS